MTGGQLRLDDVEVAEVRPTEWIWFGPEGREALGPDRPGRFPRRRDSSYVGAPALDQIVTSGTAARLAPTGRIEGE